MAGQGFADVGEVDVAVLWFAAGRDALAQDHPGDVQYLDDAGFAQRLVPGTRNAAVHAGLLEDLPQTCFVGCLVRLHVAAGVDPDAVLAVIDQQDALISQDEARRGEVFRQ